MKKASVIIPVYNEEKYLSACLKSIFFQSLKPYEIIIVDDGSNDGSLFLIVQIKKDLRIKNMIVLKQKHQGPAVARNLGAKKARGEILIFLDTDMIYDKQYIKELIKPIATGKEIASFALKEYVANLDNIWAKFWDDITFANYGKRMIKNQSKRGIVTRAILKSEFVKTNGFSNIGYSDDVTVLQQLNKTAIGISRAVCYHFNPDTLTEVFLSSRWMGRDFSRNKQISKYFIFSPVWSLFKAIIGLIKYLDIRFIIFRLIFDFGYFIGLIDTRLTNKYYK